MAASIRSLRNGGTPVIGASRDDLQLADVVALNAVVAATTYGWTLAYKPEGSTAVFSGSPVAQSPGSFTVDKEGPYLIRLTVDLGLPTESTQYVRLRWLTVLGDIGLVAAGERNDGGTPIPVDATSVGWANNQNANLLKLLDLLQPIVTSGRVLYVDANAGTEGHGDYSTVQAAIDAAAVTATVAAPWVVLVRPGTYVENLTFQPFVHVMGWPGTNADPQVVRLQSGAGTHLATTTAASDLICLLNLTLVNVNSTPTAAVVRKTGSGSLYAQNCSFLQEGSAATIGSAFRLVAGSARFTDCAFQLAASGFVDRVAVTLTAGTLTLNRCTLVGNSGLLVEAGGTATLTDTQVTSTAGALSWGISSDSTSLELNYCKVLVAGGDPVLVNPSASALPSVALTARWSFFDGDVSLDTTNVVGTSSLSLGSCEYANLVFPGGAPTFVAAVKSKSLYYDNALSGLAAENVQDAIDEVTALATAVQTLDDAYDGGVGGGIGRTIVADSGAVQIVDAPAPSDPPPPGNTNGRLQAVGGVEIGSIGFPEILLDPNPFGGGPMATMGSRVWANNAPFGSTAYLIAQSTGTPLYRNYNLRLQTESADGGSRVGHVLVRAGDGLPTSIASVNAGSVFVQGGSGLSPLGGSSGDVYIVPGYSATGVTGRIYLASNTTGTEATLTAVGAFVGGVSGTIRFATDMGGISVDILAGDTLAAVLAKFNATGQVTATHTLGVITLTTVTRGLSAEIYFLNDTVGNTLDTALGQFSGQSQVNGTWPRTIALRVTDTNEITIGVGGSTGPLVYNADTGKLTVPGLIDPTGIIFEEAGPPTTRATEGAVFVSDGTAGLTLGDLYYRGPSNAVPISVGGGGGAPVTTYVFRPGGVAAGNVYTDFNLLYTAMSGVEGPKILMFDDSVTSPILIPPKSGGGGFYSFAGVTAYGLSKSAANLTYPGPIVRFSNDGVDQARCNSFFDYSYNIAWEADTLATLPAVVLNDVMDHTIYMTNCWVTPGGAAEFFRVNGGGGFPETNLFLTVRQTVINSGAVSAFRIINNGYLYLEMNEGGSLANCLETDASAFIDIYYDSTVAPSPVQTSCVASTFVFTAMSTHLADTVTLRAAQPGGNTVQMSVTGAEELTIGNTLPLVYNAVTGKLTVPGVIDPTALVFEEAAAAPVTVANEGGLFVGNGTAPFADNTLYWVPASAGTPVDLGSYSPYTAGSAGYSTAPISVQDAAADTSTVGPVIYGATVGRAGGPYWARLADGTHPFRLKPRRGMFAPTDYCGPGWWINGTGIDGQVFLTYIQGVGYHLVFAPQFNVAAYLIGSPIPGSEWPWEEVNANGNVVTWRVSVNGYRWTTLVSLDVSTAPYSATTEPYVGAFVQGSAELLIERSDVQ